MQKILAFSSIAALTIAVVFISAPLAIAASVLALASAAAYFYEAKY